MSVTIIGGGLAGVEATQFLTALGVRVRLIEMRPRQRTAAHKTGDLAELVCSNSFGSRDIVTGKGLLLSEMRALGSVVAEVATRHAVPAGNSLAVERIGFAQDVTRLVRANPLVEIVEQEALELPSPSDGPTIVATGPLTGTALSADIARLTGVEHLAFYDAIAPIVTADSLDHEIIYAATRYGKGDPDFLNCPLTREQYDAFIETLLQAEKVEPKAFEQAMYFEGCMPIEEMASRGHRTLAFGPMRPVGLEDPRTGRRPYAVVQLRREDVHGQLYNLVGFQTKLKYGEQKRVFGMIPGLANADFVRLGSVHRNTFIKSPAVLDATLALRARPNVWFAGQIVGVEGYAESAAMGMMAARAVWAHMQGRAFAAPPVTTAIGALLHYLQTADAAHFQPMNFNFGLVPPLADDVRRGKRERREAAAQRAQRDLGRWMNDFAADALAPESASRRAS